MAGEDRGLRPRHAHGMPDDRVRTPTSALWRCFAGLAWLGLGGACLLIEWNSKIDWGRDGSLAMSVLATLFGAWVFWSDGGRRITAVGLYNLAFAFFVGFSGLYQTVKMWTSSPGVPLFTAVAVCYFVQVVTWLLFWSGTVAHPRPLPSNAGQADGRTAGWAVKCGLLLLILAVTMSMVAPDSLPVANPIGFVGVVLLAVGLLRGPLAHHTFLWGVVLLIAFGFYFTYLFNGFGRIVVGTLALALLVISAHRDQRPYTKLLILGGTAPALWFLAGLRATGAQGSPFTSDQDGFESAISPLRSFAQLLQLNEMGVLPRAWGETFVNAAVGLVPRALWDDKPIGFGADLVPLLSPELVGTGHSAAALSHGEWLYNFGLLGLALMVPATGLAVRLIDRVLAWASSSPLTTPYAVGAYAGAIVTAVSLFDFLWVGSFTYVVRGGGRLLVLAAVVLLIGWRVSAAAVPNHLVDRNSIHAARRARSGGYTTTAAPGPIGRPSGRRPRHPRPGVDSMFR
ncbi:hypothetical protein ACFOW4_01195 [Micromonospora sp. GCM10011542]|uniref:hypothetical protein n=1 Tax=Micromonospora sp. GCM10011542 TaxID=3317337 RepID=UPI00361C80C2